MNRRHFLRAGAGGAATLTASHRSGAASPDAGPDAGAATAAAASKPPIPIGFLGSTYSHGPDKIRLVRNAPEWELVGVCEPNEAGRAAVAALGVPLVSREELLARAAVVAVESDVRDHAAHALIALQAGRHVHLEKPPADRLDALRAVIREARQRDRLLQVGFMWRYHPGFQAIREMVQRGWLGEVFQIRGFLASRVPAARRREWAEFKGGAMFELGCHLVDATVRLLGRPLAVTPVLRRHGAFDDTLADNNVVVLEYARATAVLTNTALQAGGTPQRSFQVLGSNGTATLMPLEPPALRVDLLEAAGPYRRGDQEIPMPEYRRYLGDFAELAAAVRGETALAADLDVEESVGETVLLASGMA